MSARLAGLEGPTRIQGADIVLYREAYLHITTTSSDDSEPGLWPDGLVPDIDAPPGEYHGTVDVTGDDVYGRKPLP